MAILPLPFWFGYLVFLFLLWLLWLGLPVVGCSVQFSSMAQLCLTLCDPMNRSTPGLPVHHQLLEFTQTHFHWVSDAIQKSGPLFSLSPTAFYLSKHQDVFQDHTQCKCFYKFKPKVAHYYQCMWDYENVLAPYLLTRLINGSSVSPCCFPLSCKGCLAPLHIPNPAATCVSGVRTWTSLPKSWFSKVLQNTSRNQSNILSAYI